MELKDCYTEIVRNRKRIVELRQIALERCHKLKQQKSITDQEVENAEIVLCLAKIDYQQSLILQCDFSVKHPDPIHVTSGVKLWTYDSA